MQKLRPQHVDIPSYHFGVNKDVGVAYYIVMLITQQIQIHSVVHFHYYIPQKYFSNGLYNEPNKDRMKKLRSWEVDVPTYCFRVHKNVIISSSRIILRLHHSQNKCCSPF